MSSNARSNFKFEINDTIGVLANSGILTEQLVISKRIVDVDSTIYYYGFEIKMPGSTLLVEVLLPQEFVDSFYVKVERN